MSSSQQLIITDELYAMAVAEVKASPKEGRLGLRLRAITSAKEFGINLVARVFGVSSNTIRSWAKSFKEDGVAGLEYKKGRGRKSSLLQPHCDAIKQWSQEDCNITADRIAIKLQDEFDIKASESAIYRALHKLGVSYITPRPVHHKQNKDLHPEFKKKSKATC